MLDKIQQQFTLPSENGQRRLDQSLVELLPTYSRTQIKSWIESGEILVDGKQKKAKDKVKGGELITVNVSLKPQTLLKAQPIPLEIVYEDESLLIINKPIGMVVHPGAGNHDQTLVNALLYHAPALSALPRAGILHRLDKNTSGLLLIAKTQAAFKSLSQQLKKRTMSREYQAIVSGNLISGGTINAPIARHPLARKQMAIVETGKLAITHYRVKEKYRAHTLLQVQLETGRTHQIRVHLAYKRHPIVGDMTYGGRLQLAKAMSAPLINALRQYKHQALHAFALGFVHPETQEQLRFEIDLPEDMRALISLLRADTKTK